MAATTIGLKISEVTERTGFSGPALRYYEEIGLVPQPERTDAGYRVYRERDVDRLRFIARAKTLGCSLDEIRDLLEVWDEDRCGPVQHELRSLVATKLGDAQARITELTALTAELRITASRLAAEPIEGACGDGCACFTIGDASDTDVARSAPVPVALGAKDAPIACSLGATDVEQRLAEWRAVTDLVVRRELLDGGVRLVFGEQPPIAEIARLVAAEYECCPFLGFALTVDGRGTALEVTAPPDGAVVLAAAFGSAG